MRPLASLGVTGGCIQESFEPIEAVGHFVFEGSLASVRA
jgi:hypothetical protein